MDMYIFEFIQGLNKQKKTNKTWHLYTRFDPLISYLKYVMHIKLNFSPSVD